MDLSVPMIDDRRKEYIDNLISEILPDFNPEMFIQFYNEDKLGGMIRNLETWLKDIFSQFKGYKDMTLNNINQYGHDFQIKVLSSLLTHKEFLVNIHDIISDEYFENPAQNGL